MVPALARCQRRDRYGRDLKSHCPGRRSETWRRCRARAARTQIQATLCHGGGGHRWRRTSPLFCSPRLAHPESLRAGAGDRLARRWRLRRRPTIDSSKRPANLGTGHVSAPQRPPQLFIAWRTCSMIFEIGAPGPAGREKLNRFDPLSPAATDNRPAKFFDYRFCCVKLCLRPFVCSGKSVAHA